METSNATNLSHDTQGPLRSYKLRRPLGDSTTPPFNQGTTWKYYYDPILDGAYERVFHNSYWKFPRIPGLRNGITFATADPDERTQLPATASPAIIITSSMSHITLSYQKEGTTRRAITQFAARASLSIVSLVDTVLRTRMPVTKLPHWEQHYLRYNKQHPATLGLLWPPSATENIQIGIATAVRGDSPCYG